MLVNGWEIDIPDSLSALTALVSVYILYRQTLIMKRQNQLAEVQLSSGQLYTYPRIKPDIKTITINGEDVHYLWLKVINYAPYPVELVKLKADFNISHCSVALMGYEHKKPFKQTLLPPNCVIGPNSKNNESEKTIQLVLDKLPKSLKVEITWKPEIPGLSAKRLSEKYLKPLAA